MSGEFGVNPANSFRDEYSKVIRLADGGFVIVWSGGLNAGTPAAPVPGTGVMAQYYNADGSARGSAILVDSVVNSAGFVSGIGGVQMANGNLAFTWQTSALSGGASTDILARIYDSTGTSITGAFTVADQPGTSQYPDDIVAVPGAGFAVVWSTLLFPVDSPASGEISVRVFGGDGSPAGDAFIANTNTVGKQSDSRAAALANGDIMVTWVDRGSVNSSPDFTIRAQIFNAAGALQGGEIMVSGAQTVTPFFPRIATLSDGRTLIAWRSASPQSFGDLFVRGQFLSATGEKIGGDFALFKMNPGASFSEFDLVPLADGGFAVSYSLFAPGVTSNTDVAFRLFDETGRQMGGELTPQGAQPSGQDFTHAGVLANGDLVLTWTSVGASQDIRARIFSLPVLMSTLGNGGSAAASVVENTTAVGTFSATSTAAGPLTYTLTGADAALFTLDPLTGELSFIERPYAAQPRDTGADNVYDVAVRASNGVTFDEQVLAITVTPDAALQTFFGSEASDRRTGSNTSSAAFYGNGGNDNLKGGALADFLFGGTGNDILTGLGGDDLIEGGEGNDKLDGGTGSDTMRGGHGNDGYVVDSAGDIVSEAGGSGIDTVTASISYVLGEGLEKLTLAGSAALNGSGNGLANTLTGNGGANVLLGFGGKDTIFGGGGDDRIDGGAQADRLRGDAGADSFVLANPGTNADRDTILDFAIGEDKVLIDRAAFAAFALDAAGALSAANFALGNATTAEHHLLYNAATGILSYDVDGVGGKAAIQIAQFTGLPGLSAADFVLI